MFTQGQDPQIQQGGGGIIPKRHGVAGFLWKMSRIGERLSPFISISCLFMAVHILFLT